MDLIQRLYAADAPYKAPTCVARYRPVFWEPVAGTGERLVALIALEPHERTETVVACKTYCILEVDRLKALLGRQRGTASHGVLQQVAEFMSAHQSAGMPVGDLEAPFHGFELGPTMTGRGYDVEQLLNAAVRSLSAFARVDALVEEEQIAEVPRSTVKTAEFLKTLKRHVVGEDAEKRARFDRKFRPAHSSLDLTIDYAYSRWIVQVTSLPATERQLANSLREAQSKLFEIDLLQEVMDGNSLSPILLVNEDVLFHNPSDIALVHASRMREILIDLAKYKSVELMSVASPEEGASKVRSLS